jgi:peptidyl-prolyl cis-trans isomerase SurA
MKAFRFFFILGAGLLLAAIQSASAGQLDRIAVVVDGNVITYLQVNEKVGSQLEFLSARYGENTPEYRAKAHELQTNALETLIQNQLILDDFNRTGFATNVLEGLVEDQIRQNIKTHYEGQRYKLIQDLMSQGKNYEEYRKEQREQLIVGYVMTWQNPGRKVLISPLKIQTYYEEHQQDFKVEDQVKLRMIVIRQPPNSPPGSAKPIANEILQKIDSGTPFAEMATVYSAGGGANGGDQGWVDRKERIAQLSDVAFALKPGEHSGVIELADEHTGDVTCYLLMVDDKRSAHIRSLTEVAPEVEQTLKDQEAKRLVNQWIKRLEAKSHIEMF